MEHTCRWKEEEGLLDRVGRTSAPYPEINSDPPPICIYELIPGALLPPGGGQFGTTTYRRGPLIADLTRHGGQAPCTRSFLGNDLLLVICTLVKVSSSS